MTALEDRKLMEEADARTGKVHPEREVAENSRARTVTTAATALAADAPEEERTAAAVNAGNFTQTVRRKRLQTAGQKRIFSVTMRAAAR